MPKFSGRRVNTTPTAFRGVWYGCGRQNTLPGHEFVYAGGKATYSAWHRPMAVYARAANRTFFVYGDAENRPAIGVFDHAASAFAEPLALGTNPDANAHRNPTLLIDEDGFLYVFYGYAGGKQPIQVLRSLYPYDISAWTHMTALTDGNGSYASPWELRPGELIVPHRQPAGWCFKKTRDQAVTWSDTVQLATFSSYEGTSTVYGLTTGETGSYPRGLHFAWSRLGGGSLEAIQTKHLWARRYNVYYACSHDGGDTWQRSDGSPCELPITEDAAERLYDSGEHGIWIKDMAVAPGVGTLILFLDADADTYRSEWKIARRTGAGWEIVNLTSSDHMYDAGAFCVLSSGDIRLYGPSEPAQPGCDGGNIEEWRSADGGKTWNKSRTLTHGAQRSHNHVKTVLNHEQSDGKFRVMWSCGDGQSPPSDTQVTMYYFGDGMDAPRQIEAS
ncbi:MAG TPA: BNR-4 repeat-containing protein [Candidatus Hydrogenedentes bacterium]|nr:BNR-4 repeat-containing protein [Candidatus Hydrogenedentota bacterium]